MKTQSYPRYGKVYLVGAGPGDPELITVKGAKMLKEADVIVYDRLANPALLSMSSEQSEHLYVGKRPDKPSVSQQQINHILVTKARSGKVVVRLKGGDPFVFGRGGEECEALRTAHVPFEVVPGISSALAAPAFAGIPVTYRREARSFTVVTGHTIRNTDAFANWEHLVHTDTLVVLMGMSRLAQIAAMLIEHGRDANTPVGVIEKATYASQRVVVGTLETIAEQTELLAPPGTIVIGTLASKSKQLAWFHAENSIINNGISNDRLHKQFAG
ncbi:uroporphyrinogen-III C-methyltransferase [Fodinibius sediminis]|uniref:uroporphyrinogen-III C-methyltransferase n=1 Tax=Fodinibius sediminis TaxID=1214077 RepID=A0A521C019_9BACT|nr:uroporphyrinogen-III C-methyltransferase [Fodinibius sediminis]SMO52171.1 uroporphyrinogen-III C-methyltransferase [Fodinibius sediminis]